MDGFITQNRIKAKNLSDILAFVLERGASSRREIERETGFSWGAVSAYAAELIAAGFLVEEKTAKAGAGRNASALKPNGDKFVAVGIDVNRTALSAEITGLDLSVKGVFRKPFAAHSQEELQKDVLTLCKRALSACEKYSVLGVGLAIQGAVDTDAGIAVHFPGIADWKPFNIKRLIEEKFGVFADLEHDPTSLLLAAASGKKEEDCLLFRADEGIGMAVMINGKVLRGAGRLEIGHTVSVFDGEECVCGRRGCLEAYSSLRGISARLKRNDKERVLREAAEHLGIAMYNAAMIFLPKKIILTGKLTEIYAETAKEAVEVFERLFGNTVQVEIRNDISAAHGAAAETLRKAIRNIGICEEGRE